MFHYICEAMFGLLLEHYSNFLEDYVVDYVTVVACWLKETFRKFISCAI